MKLHGNALTPTGTLGKARHTSDELPRDCCFMHEVINGFGILRMNPTPMQFLIVTTNTQMTSPANVID